ncbi:putative DNA-binding domain-containing protein [Bdellovibrio sp. HCB337]|uniref:HvfC/BufC family peptide modification chaperone n=1 Tax=Bdellovibrio sp. HCB337 TaxID=3394358 RepID=UPI0039A50CC3
MKNQIFYNCLIGKGAPELAYKPAGKLRLEDAFAIYQRGYIARLTESLGDTFESVWQVLGDELFFEVARQFIQTHESQTYNLSDYSVKFVDFLISQPVSQELPFLSDLAHLGWMHKEVFHRPTQVGRNGTDLMRLLEDDQHRAELVDSVELLKSPYCLFDIWKALKENLEPPSSWQGPQYLVLYKSGDQVFVKQISFGLYQAFEKIRQGQALMASLEHLEEFELTELFHFLAKNHLLK